MPWNEVPGKFKSGNLHSGSPMGPKVKDKKQMLAIMLSEKREAGKGKSEYQEKEPLKEALGERKTK